MKKIIFILSIIILTSTGTFAQTTSLQVIHNSADPVLDSVDVYVNVPLLGLDQELIANFPFRASFFYDLSGVISFIPGGMLPVKVQVTPGGQSDTVINEGVTLDSGKKYLAFAAGVVDTANFVANPDGKSIALALDTLERVPIGSTGGNVNITAFNGVTDAPALDVIVPGFGTVISNLGYGSFVQGLVFPALPFDAEFKVVAHNDTNNVLGTFIGNLGGYSDQAIVMFASGFVNPAANQNGAPFGLFIADTGDTVVALQKVTGINNIGKNLSALNLYPNPAQDLLKYEYTLSSPTDISVTVFNNAGALIYSRHFGMQTPGKYDESFDVSKFAAGIYTVKIGDTKNSSASTFVRK